MNFIFAYLIKSSVSLAFLYCLFRFTVRNNKNHALNRYLLLGILFASALIPLLHVQFFYEEVQLAPVEFVREFVASPIQENFPLADTGIEATDKQQNNPINLWLVSYLSMAGIAFLRLLFSFFQIAKILKRAEKLTYQKVILAVVKDFIQPFSFLNKVILSEKDYTENKDIVVAHEYAHIKYLHAVDLMLCELFIIVQFFNPFMWLLRRDLKLIHEYQADKAVLNKGIDAQKYQLLVLEKAVGERRFAMANRFTQKPILKRLNMMNKNKIDKWAAVKLLLFVPIIAVLLQAFARPELITKPDDFIPVRYTENRTEKWLSKWTVDKIGKGYFEPGIKVDEHQNTANNFLMILMNSKDQYLVENEIVAKSEIKQITLNYLLGKKPNGKPAPDFVEKEIAGIGKIKVCNGLISYRHDVASSREAVNYALRQIGEAYLEVRQKKAQILFNDDYFDLNEEKQLAVNEAVPVWFAYEYPKGPKPSVWLPFDGKPAPNPKPFMIKFKNNGEVIVEDHTFNSLDEFYKNIEVWSKELADFNKGKRSKAFYRAYLFYENKVYETLSKEVSMKLYKNNIHVEHISSDRAPLKLQEGKLKERAEKVSEEVKKAQEESVTFYVKIDDKGKYYWGRLFHVTEKEHKGTYIAWDKEIDLDELRELINSKKKYRADRNLETDLIGKVAVGEGVAGSELNKLKKVLRELEVRFLNYTGISSDGINSGNFLEFGDEIYQIIKLEISNESNEHDGKFDLSFLLKRGDKYITMHFISIKTESVKMLQKGNYKLNSWDYNSRDYNTFKIGRIIKDQKDSDCVEGNFTILSNSKEDLSFSFSMKLEGGTVLAGKYKGEAGYIKRRAK